MLHVCLESYSVSPYYYSYFLCVLRLLGHLFVSVHTTLILSRTLRSTKDTALPAQLLISFVPFRSESWALFVYRVYIMNIVNPVGDFYIKWLQFFSVDLWTYPPAFFFFCVSALSNKASMFVFSLPSPPTTRSPVAVFECGRDVYAHFQPHLPDASTGPLEWLSPVPGPNASGIPEQFMGSNKWVGGRETVQHSSSPHLFVTLIAKSSTPHVVHVQY